MPKTYDGGLGEAAALCRAAADRFFRDAKRPNQVDRHVADVLTRMASRIMELANPRADAALPAGGDDANVEVRLSLAPVELQNLRDLCDGMRETGTMGFDALADTILAQLPDPGTDAARPRHS
jgi:hypothetical protein